LTATLTATATATCSLEKGQVEITDGATSESRFAWLRSFARSSSSPFAVAVAVNVNDYVAGCIV
jgi:hypothetical protein